MLSGGIAQLVVLQASRRVSRRGDAGRQTKTQCYTRNTIIFFNNGRLLLVATHRVLLYASTLRIDRTVSKLNLHCIG